MDVAGIHEFNSTRKRMSIVTRNSDGKLRLSATVFDRNTFFFIFFFQCKHWHWVALTLRKLWMEFHCLCVPGGGRVYVKGADNVMVDRAAASFETQRAELEAQLVKYVLAVAIVWTLKYSHKLKYSHVHSGLGLLHRSHADLTRFLSHPMSADMEKLVCEHLSTAYAT